jgi:hypothetical protein
MGEIDLIGARIRDDVDGEDLVEPDAQLGRSSHGEGLASVRRGGRGARAGKAVHLADGSRPRLAAGGPVDARNGLGDHPAVRRRRRRQHVGCRDSFGRRGGPVLCGGPAQSGRSAVAAGKQHGGDPDGKCDS